MRIDAFFPLKQTIDIVDGAGEPTDVKFEVLGHDSRAYRDASKKALRAVNAKSSADDLDVVEKANAELTAASIVGWSGLETADGAPLPYSKEKALELMLMPELSFMREQVDAFVAERATFFRKGEKAA